MTPDWISVGGDRHMLITTDIKLTGAIRIVSKVARNTPYAAKEAVNWTAASMVSDLQWEMARKFREPKPFTIRSVGVDRYEWATIDKPVAIVRLKEPARVRERQHYLVPQIEGGGRPFKPFEGALRNKGVMPSGLMAVTPKDASWAVRMDPYGNIQPAQVVQLLSYFGALREHNMLPETKEKLAKYGRTKKGYKTIGGRVYFVSNGRGELPPGIWAKKGIHGQKVAPVLLFTKSAHYRAIFDFHGIAQKIIARELEPNFRKALLQALATTH